MINTNLSQYILSSVPSGHSVCSQQVTMLVVSLQQVTMLFLVLVLHVVTVTACKGGGSEPAVVKSSEDQTGDRHFTSPSNYLMPQGYPIWGIEGTPHNQRLVPPPGQGWT